MDYIQSCRINWNPPMRSSQIKPISYLKANAAEVLERLAESRYWLHGSNLPIVC